MKILNPEYKGLNPIKNFSPEGFYYWYKTLELREYMESMEASMREAAATSEF